MCTYYTSTWSKRLTILLIPILFLSTQSCKKLIDATSPTGIIPETKVFTDDATAISVLNGIYTDMSTPSNTGGFTGRFSISFFCGLSADELTLHSIITTRSLIDYHNNDLKSNEVGNTGSELWPTLYNQIYRCNAVIQGLNKSATLTPAVKTQLLGEARFLRGFFYFYLAESFGDVPLALSTDYTSVAKLPRSSLEEVYDQIITDLTIAKETLSESFLREDALRATTDRIRPTKWAAISLLARVYLFTHNFEKSIGESNEIINNKPLFQLSELNNVFLKNSTEAIWQLQPTSSFYNTEDGRHFIIPASGFSATYPVYLSDTLLNSFSAVDKRKVEGNWVNSRTISGKKYYYPYKYKVGTQNSAVTSTANMSEYQMVLRLGEQYLIRAEASARLNQLPSAISDLNTIRNRAGLLDFISANKDEVIAAIINERKHELFTEWGHRWYDLKRTGTIDPVMKNITPIKAGGSPWRAHQKLFPLPYGDITKSQALQQNAGY